MLPQPTTRTKDVETLWTRLREAVEGPCGGIETENTGSQILIGRWQAWSSADGLYVTRCVATVLPEDTRFSEVRLTFSARRCGTGSLDDVQALAANCEPIDSIPQLVKDQLEILWGKFERIVRR